MLQRRQIPQPPNYNGVDGVERLNSFSRLYYPVSTVIAYSKGKSMKLMAAMKKRIKKKPSGANQRSKLTLRASKLNRRAAFSRCRRRRRRRLFGSCFRVNSATFDPDSIFTHGNDLLARFHCYWTKQVDIKRRCNQYYDSSGPVCLRLVQILIKKLIDG